MRKLADGKCWMVSNLELDLSTQELSSSWSDVTSNKAPVTSSSYATKNATNNSWGGNGDTIARSWNPRYHSSYSSNLYRVNSAGTFSWSSTGNAMTERRGSYYNWVAATANTVSMTFVGTATQSICPAGFKLPLGGTTTTPGSFGYMLAQYGFSDSSTSVQEYYFYMYPFSFTPVGYHANSGTNVSAANQLYITRTANTKDYVYDLGDGQAYITSEYSGKGHGFTIRCVSI